MPCCPNGVYQPLITDCGGNIRPLQSNESLRVSFINNSPPSDLLTEDTTFYIEIWGDDNSPGTATEPWKTIHGALDRLSTINPASFTITVELGYGIFQHDRQIKPNMPFGGSVNFEGKRTNTNALAPILSNIDGSYTANPNPGGAGTNLQYFDCDVDLTGLTGLENVAVGNFYRIYTATGGVNPFAVVGLHKIIAFNGTTDVATLRIWSRTGVSALPSGIITVAGANIEHTVITWDTSVDSHGVEVVGTNAGIWKDITFEGNQNQFDARRGMRVWAGGSISPNTRVGVHNFDVGLEVFAGGHVEMPVASISKVYTLAISVGGGAVVRFNFQSTTNGCGTAACQSQQWSTVSMGDSKHIGSGNVQVMLAWKSGHIDLTNSFIYFGDGSTTGIVSQSLSNVNADGVTFSGLTTNKSEVTQGRIEPPPP